MITFNDMAVITLTNGDQVQVLGTVHIRDSRVEVTVDEVLTTDGKPYPHFVSATDLEFARECIDWEFRWAAR